MDDNGKGFKSKYFRISLYVFITGACLLLFNRLLDSMGDLFAWWGVASSALMSTLLPFFIAVVLAYMFRPLVTHIANGFGRLMPRENAEKGAVRRLRTNIAQRRRFIAACIVYIILIALIVLALTYGIPTLVRNVIDLVQNLPEYISALLKWVDTTIIKNENIPIEIRQAVEELLQTGNDTIGSAMRGAVAMLPTLLQRIYRVSTISLNIVLAIVLSFYLVVDEGRLFRSVREWLRRRLGPKHSRRFFGFMSDLDFMFSKYLIGRLLESLVVGILSFIVMTILKLPYTALLATLYGITNMIPYVGPVIGLIPPVCVAILINPTTALLVAILLTAIQCLDAYVLAPKVLGDSMGLNPFWIVFALVLGGAMFGVVGLLLGTPVMGVLMRMIERNTGAAPALPDADDAPDDGGD